MECGIRPDSARTLSHAPSASLGFPGRVSTPEPQPLTGRSRQVLYCGPLPQHAFWLVGFLFCFAWRRISLVTEEGLKLGLLLGVARMTRLATLTLLEDWSLLSTWLGVLHGGTFTIL